MQRVSINGVNAEHLSVLDRGLQYGDGLFETIACVDGGLQFWQQHMQRMQAGAALLNIEFPGAAACLDDIRQLAATLTEDSFVIKILLTRGQSTRGYRAPERQKPNRIVILSAWPGYAAENSRAGVSLCLCKQPVSINPALAGIKHLNRLDSVMARSEWRDEYQEGLMMDADGNIIEGTMSNVFGIRAGTLYTPGLDRCGVDGIIRNQVLAIAHDENITVKTANIPVDDLYSMHELFITNSLIGIWPVRLLEEHDYLGAGETTLKLADKLQRRMLEHAKTRV